MRGRAANRKALPLALKRGIGITLEEQMFRGLRDAILHGTYAAGAQLPSVDELAVGCGVSEKVSRHALARLAAEGWCATTRGTRAVVTDRGKERLGNVLLFNSETGYGFHSSWMAETIRAELLKNDWRLRAISAHDLRRDGSSKRLSEALQERWDLVLEMGMRPGARHAIETAGWPFVVLGDGGKCIASAAPNCIGKIELQNGLSAPSFVRACAKENVRRVIQYLYAEGGFDVSGTLSAAGIVCETVRTPRVREPYGMYAGAYKAMSEFLRRKNAALPDVFLFTDDHLAQGGLLALMEHGRRVPEDVRVVTHANRGLGPFWIKPLTRLEMDPVAQGEAIAKAVLSYLQTKTFPNGLVLGSEWIRGETF